MNADLDELRQRMERATARIAVPSGLARRAAQHRRRRILIRVTAAAGIAAVVAGVAIAPAMTTPGDLGTTDAITNARLVSDIRSALDAATAGHDIEYMSTPNGLGKSWSYQEAHKRLTRSVITSGPSRTDDGSTATPTSVSDIDVDYALKTVFTSTTKADLLRNQPVPPASCATPVGANVMLSIVNTPTALSGIIHKALNCGQLTHEGTENVHGTNAIKLLSVLGRSKQGGALTVTLWVNPATYLPVRWQWTATGNGLHLQLVWDILWLPPTRANLADLRVPIPPGFKIVAIPHS